MATPAADDRREKRRRAMLDAACRLFLENGYEATTLNDVVARSGGSLATLYDLFGGKPGLLLTMVSERCARIAALISGAQLSQLELADGLSEIARHFLDQLTDGDGIALFRVVVAEAPRQPELGRLFYEAGPATTRQLVADYLKAQPRSVGLEIGDAQEAATLFIHMVIGEYHIRQLCGIPTPLEDHQRETHISRAVEAFMRLYAERAGGA